MKTTIFSVLIVITIWLPNPISAQSIDSTQNQSPKFTLKTDLNAPLRGNPAISFILDYQPKGGLTHSFGLDIVYNFMEQGGLFQLPYSPKFKGPSGAISYAIKPPTNSKWYVGGITHLGAYTLSFQQIHCLASEQLDSEPICKCTQWGRNNFNHTNLKLNISGLFGYQLRFKKITIGQEVKIGGYRVWNLRRAPLQEDVINCPDIGSGVMESSIYSQLSLVRNDTNFLEGSKIGVAFQASLFLGYQF